MARVAVIFRNLFQVHRGTTVVAPSRFSGYEIRRVVLVSDATEQMHERQQD